MNGDTYESIMPQLALNDEQISSVLTYVYSQWGNNGSEVSPGMVADVRAKPAPAVAGGAE